MAVKRQLRGVVVCCLLAAVGCGTWPMGYDLNANARRRKANVLAYEGLTERQIANGVMEQNTVFPYHFEPDSSRLTAVGERDLAILAKRHRESPGTLNVRMRTASQVLYMERVSTVLDFLAKRGVDTGRITVVDVYPGGAGMPSEDVYEALTRDREESESSGGAMGAVPDLGGSQ